MFASASVFDRIAEMGRVLTALPTALADSTFELTGIIFEGGLAQHQIKVHVPSFDRRIGDRFEITEDCGHRFWVVSQSADDTVTVVLFVTLDQKLGREQSLSVVAHGDMDMRSTAGVRHGLDRSEMILTVGVGHESSVTLEILVLVFAIRFVARM